MSNRPKSDHRKTDRQVFPFYSLIFGIYPVLALAGFNIAEIDFSITYRSILLSLLLSAVLFALLRLILRNWTRAAFLSLLLLLLFFSYGHVYSLLKTSTLFGFPLGRHRLLILVWTVLAALAVWFSTRRRSVNLLPLTPTLNLVSVALLILPIFQIVQFEIKNHPLHSISAASVASAASPASSSLQTSPDIYYIILDAYMRADNLQAVYGYDNSAFIADLTKRGFYVADCSQSNYAYTQLSLGSSLNLNYLDSFSVSANDQVNPLLQDNAVRKFLKDHGYTVVAFETGFRWSQWEDADVYYKYQPNGYLLNAFESLYLQTTLFRMPLDYMKSSEFATDGAIRHNRILFDLETLKNMPDSVKSPKFIFAHLVIPHPPFVFGPNGEFVTEQMLNAAYLPGYRNSVTFINAQILQVVDRIIANSKTPPVIIIQGDHGAPYYNTPDQRMTILNAYYLPGVKAQLYPTITPVNTFRIIFNTYFEQNYPILQDISRYSTVSDMYNFTIIPNTCGK